LESHRPKLERMLARIAPHACAVCMLLGLCCSWIGIWSLGHRPSGGALELCAYPLPHAKSLVGVISHIQETAGPSTMTCAASSSASRGVATSRQAIPLVPSRSQAAGARSAWPDVLTHA
jgi:hypothetical protein